MKELAYYNGKIGPLGEMTVPMADRACWFGDGVYEAQMCRNGRLFTLDEHVDRLFSSAAQLRITVPMEKEALKALLRDLVRQADTANALVYYQVTRGSGPRSHAFPKGNANLWVTITPKEMNESREPVGLITAEDTRFLHCNIKTLNLIPSVMANQRAQEAGCYECVLYRPGGRVTECSHSNVHVLSGGALLTAPADNLILPGITRAHLIAACQRLGIPVRQAPFTVEELKAADEIFTTSSTRLLARADRVDGRAAGMKRNDLYQALYDALYQEYFTATET